MSVRSWSYPVLALLVLVFGGFAASTAQAEGNAAQGKLLGYTCLGCHGVDNYRNAYPNYSVPKLVGQHPEYLVIALNEYKSGERSHGTMHAQASSFSDQDMLDLSLYLAGEPVKSAAGAKPAMAPPAAVATCSACHGTDGVGIVNIYPTLAGQHADYIEQALNDYRAGRRRNAVMSAFAAALKPADIKAVALYFSQQKPALQTLARPTSRYSAAAK
jgi:cytochrome c553